MSLRDWTKQSGVFKIGEFIKSQGELITNGDFSDGATGWTTTSPWTIDVNANNAVYNKTTNNAIITAISLEKGKRYVVSFDVQKLSTGFAYLAFVNEANSALFLGGTYKPFVTGRNTFITEAQNDSISLKIYASITSGSVFTIDNISITEVDPLPTITDGTKYLECTSAGNLYIPLTNMSVGTYEFDINMTNVGIFSNLYILDSPTLSSAVGYGFSAGYRNRITRYAGSDTLILQSVSGVNLVNTWYSLKITRTVTGVITMYIRGGAYGNNWTLVSTTGGMGSNPVTDTNYFNAKIALFALRVGDKIANIKFYDGVRQ